MSWEVKNGEGKPSIVGLARIITGEEKGPLHAVRCFREGEKINPTIVEKTEPVRRKRAFQKGEGKAMTVDMADREKFASEKGGGKYDSGRRSKK